MCHSCRHQAEKMISVPDSAIRKFQKPLVYRVGCIIQHLIHKYISCRFRFLNSTGRPFGHYILRGIYMPLCVRLDPRSHHGMFLVLSRFVSARACPFHMRFSKCIGCATLLFSRAPHSLRFFTGRRPCAPRLPLPTATMCFGIRCVRMLNVFCIKRPLPSYRSISWFDFCPDLFSNKMCAHAFLLGIRRPRKCPCCRMTAAAAATVVVAMAA